MSCHQTPEMVAASFDEELSARQQDELQQHLATCATCRNELAGLQSAAAALHGWRNEAVPDWDRADATAHGLRSPSREHRQPLGRRHSWRSSLGHTARWIPLAASLVLAIAVMTQTRIDVADGNWSVSFGSSAAERQLAQVEDYLAQHAQYQQQQNQIMVEAALQQFGDSTTDSLYQLVEWFEQQRTLDLQRMEAGFQQMLDRDYQTVNSMQQLASFVQYQGELP